MNLRNITSKIVEERIRRNYSQTYLAEKMGISQKAYSKIETGETRITIQNLISISEILNIDFLDFFEESSSAPKYSSKQHNGDGIVMNKNISENSSVLYERLLTAKDNEISLLKKIIENYEKNNK